MARRSGLVERLSSAAASLSWPLALGLAAVSFIVLHMLDSRLAPVAAGTLVFALQFIVPILCVLSAVLSLRRRAAARRLFEIIANTEASSEACDTQRVAIVRAIEAERESEHGPMRRREDHMQDERRHPGTRAS
jgi:hypothetical protein